ncbi:carbohydrate binding family 9 domain-containing protein [Aquincola sp. S2]|uniref:Carbohydrate binding family 9 domain-containing protein n=1 Tax=Pseudaquabacterium terrae TaxID=2732868 RepID=A0ABX2EFM2_9BURK|nr:carbohydrate binding family 9 domain-containing protein [Aquabacterium terrae]NRF67414.1 carbohydrate binding family 9 domain-containing protein [Aquabacterium terrae]
MSSSVLTRSLSLLSLALAAAAALAQAPAVPPAPPIIAARLAAGEQLPLDGTLAHPAWQRAPVFTDFVEKWPETGRQPLHETRVRVLFDEAALYIGVEALDERPQQIRAPLVRHDMVNRTQDFVFANIDAIGARQAAQFFRVNAAGSTGDGIYTAADDTEDFAPDFDFDAVAKRHERGYTVVMRIPFGSLRFDSEGDPAWRIMIGRRVPRDQVYLHTSVLIPVDAPSFIATLQPLQGVQLPAHQQFLTLRPSLTWRQQRTRSGDGPTTRERSIDATLDLKWRPLPELVIDATLNPDFSQVALDVPQLAGNTRFALFVDEKRPFFFESSDLLRSPTDAIYTRSFTEPKAGLRATWRGRSLAATAFGIDDRGGGIVLLPGPYASGEAEQPASQALVARVLSTRAGLQWGGLAVARRYAGDRGANNVFGPDVSWQVDEAWRVRGQWLHSETTALPDGQGKLRRGVAQAADRVRLTATRLTDQTETSLTLDDIGQGFRHDSGFVVQNGARNLNAFLGKAWRNWGPLNEFWINLRVDDSQAKSDGKGGSGERISRDVHPGFWLVGPHNLEAELHWHGRAQLRTRPGGVLHDEHFWQGELIVTPAAWFPLLTVGGRAGRVVDVEADALRRGGNAQLIMTMRPHARLELEPRAEYAWTERNGRRAYRESSAQLLAVWHFDARQTLRAIVQRYTYDRRDEPGLTGYRLAGTDGSLTYAWRQSSGSVLYVGAGRSRQGVDGPARSNELFVKLQVDVDELRRRF